MLLVLTLLLGANSPILDEALGGTVTRQYITGHIGTDRRGGSIREDNYSGREIWP